MPRQYKTKGPDKLSVAFSVPMKPAHMDVLASTAVGYGMSKTDLARQYILIGLGLAEEPQKAEGAA